MTKNLMLLLFFVCKISYSGECKSLESLKPISAPLSDVKSALNFDASKPSITAEDLNEFEFTLSTYQVDKNGNLTSVIGKIEDINLDYKTIYSFNQYKTAKPNKKYGVSIRLIMNYKSRESGISIQNLFGALGVGGNYKKIDGEISLSVHGMKNPKAAYVLPVPTKLDENSTTQFLNYLSILKAMISEQNSIDPVELPNCM